MRFHYIQMLRFAAAAGVLLYHAHVHIGRLVGESALARAFDVHFSWGVELFFAISGFVIAHSLARTPPARFAAHRVLRIYPAYALAFLGVIAAKWALGVDAPSLDAAVRGVSLLPVCCADYPLGVEWSLVYEIFFYALVAAIAGLPWRNAREWAMLGWLLAIGAAAWWEPSRATAFLPGWRLIVLSAFNLPFIAGVLAYAWFCRVERVPMIPLVCALPVALFAANQMSATEAQLAWLAVGFGALVLAAAELSRRRDASARHPIVRLGDWSYGLYLVHVPVVRAVATAFGASPQWANAAFVIALAVALAAGLAFGAAEMALYRYNRAWLVRRSPGAAGIGVQTKA